MSADRKTHSDVECVSLLCQHDSGMPFSPDEIKTTVTNRLLKCCMKVKRETEGPIIVEELLAMNYQWKIHSVPSDCSFQDFLICITAKICFLWSVDDSELISRVLKEIYEFHGHFRWIFQSSSGFPDGDSKLLEINPSPWGVTISGLIIVEYFLYHANKEHLVFEKSRFVDLKIWPPTFYSPIDYAMDSKNPKLLLLVLRYGAKVKDHGEERCSGFNHSLKYLLRILWRCLKSSSRKDCFETRDMVRCINILLRAIPQIKFTHFGFNIGNLNNRMTFHMKSGDFVKDLVNYYKLPKLEIRLFHPSELQHLCRCAIRNSLNINWMLPCGIQQLPIPDILMRYIDLFED